MKKILCACLVLLVMALSLASCNSGLITEPTVTVSDDGYLMVNGVKTEHKVDKEDVITVEDGYVVVNGVKTEHKVDTEGDNNLPTEKPDTIEILDGYLVVNGVKTEHKVHSDPIISVIDGYVAVNGVKTEYKVGECDHIWETVTTNPTCAAGGYDTMTCKLCEKQVVTNETQKLNHTYLTSYSVDDNYHWFKCSGCNAIKNKATHTPNDDNECTVCGTPLSATPGVVYDIAADGTYAEVVAYNGTATKVKIASEYNGLPVKNIYDKAFENNTTVTSVTIPDSVTNIGGDAFKGCEKLASIVIPDSVITIGQGAFYADNKEIYSSLTSVVIGNSVTSIGDEAFHGCSKLTSIVIPDSVITIGNSAFEECYGLTSVVIPDSVTSIGSSAFSYCRGLTSVVIGDSVTTIGERAFYNCSTLTSVVIGNRVTSIVSYAFWYCSGLTSVVIPDSVTTIGERAFEYCSGITEISIPDSITSIGENAFNGCSNLQFNEYDNCRYLGNENNPYVALISTTNNLSNYTIHDNTKIIADYAFRESTRLTSIVIPNSVTSIGGHAFAFCTSLNNVYYTGNEEEWKAIVILASMSNYNLTNATIHYNYIPEEQN